MSENEQSGLETAVLGGGCFWCIEAALAKVSGVKQLISGFCGGLDENPDYRWVCTGQSDHVEVVEVTFDPAIVAYEQLLAVFFAAHDPTQLNRQGNDVGPQYRSAIFYQSEQQHAAAQALIAQMTEAQVFDAPIVTEVRPAMPFYPADEGHQDYYRLNSQAPYCQIVIKPKLDKIDALMSAGKLPG